MIVQCRVVDANWKKRLSDEGIVNLELAKARTLESRGMVEIIDKQVTSLDKVVNTYKTKILVPESPGATKPDYWIKNSFDYKKKVKVAWVQDYSKPNGGAELSNQTICRIGELLGFDLALVTPQSFNVSILTAADIIIINNFFEFQDEHYTIMYNVLYEKRIPYVKYDHDYREIHKRADKARQMFTMSLLNVFISPDHMNKTIDILGEQIRSHSICLPIAIDTRSYINYTNDRIKNSVLIPRIEKCKATVRNDIETLKTFEKITVIGNNEFVAPDGIVCNIIEKQDPAKMPELYNMYEYMYHKPDVAWAGERIYLEAKLCGCIPIPNENVGHVSWGELTAGQLTDALYTFWKEIDKLCLKR